MNTRELAKRLAVEHKLPRAERYDVVYRDFDDMVEVIGWMQDPTYDMKDFEGREMLFLNAGLQSVFSLRRRK